MFCSKCSAENPYNANFCFNCAYPLTANFDTVSNARQVEPLGAANDDEILTEIRRIESFSSRDAPVQKTENNKNSINAFAATLAIVFSVVTGLSFLLHGISTREEMREVTNTSVIKTTATPVEVAAETPQIVKPKARKTVEPQTIVESDYAANMSGSIPSSNNTKYNSNNSYTGNTMTNVGATRCTLSNNGSSVYLRQNCDTKDCTKDKSTIYSQAADNQELYVANTSKIDSGSGFYWIPLEFDNSIVYAASTKLDCNWHQY